MNLNKFGIRAKRDVNTKLGIILDDKENSSLRNSMLYEANFSAINAEIEKAYICKLTEKLQKVLI